jgi:Fe-S-cluster-containing hydrogenase component 2
LCARVCPVGAASGEKKEPHKIDQSICTKCGLCADACKFDAIDVT